MVEGYHPAGGARAGRRARLDARDRGAVRRRCSTGGTVAGRRGDPRPAARAFGPTGRRRVGRHDLGLHQPVARRRRRLADHGDLPASVVALSDKPGGTDEGRAMAEIVYDEAPGISGIVFATRQRRAGAPRRRRSTRSSPRRQGHRRRHELHHGAVLPGRRHRAGRRSRPGRRRRLLRRRRQRRPAELGGDVQRRRERGLRPGPGGVDTVQTIGTLRAAHERDARAAVGRAVGTRDATDFAIDVYRINGAGHDAARRTVNTNNIATGIPEEVAPHQRHRQSATPTGSRIRRVAGTGKPLLKFIDFTNGAGTVAIEHPDQLERDQPGRRLGERRADRRGRRATRRRRRPRASARAGP